VISYRDMIMKVENLTVVIIYYYWFVLCVGKMRRRELVNVGF